MSKEEQQQHITSIGGQAVMEGVMMRGPFKTAVAVRKPDGDIECKVEENGTKTRKKFWRLPIIRGCVSFVDSLVIGMKALMFSAEFVDIEEEEKTESKFDKWLDDKFGDKIKDIVIYVSIDNIACIQYCFVYWYFLLFLRKVRKKSVHLFRQFRHLQIHTYLQAFLRA